MGRAYEIVKAMPVKEAMLWIDKNSVKPVNSLIKSEYLHKEWSPLGIKCKGQYRGCPKMANIDNYLENID